ncbi:MAG: polyphosphate kinase 2 family protein [Planctomycetes bacterium]|nr:polyphosphate kinase 2 family protein [Planctomycetota bacterium]
MSFPFVDPASLGSPYLVPFDGSFRVAECPTRVPDAPKKKASEKALETTVERMDKLQRKLYADDRYSLLLVFQAMDAAGKDSTIRAVLTGVNPAGCQVFSFKQPSAEELDHDFLWRTYKRMPERGRIGVFNRSYYEEVLVVRVHPEYLQGQRLPSGAEDLPALWRSRYASIRTMEEHLARNGTVVIKFWLNVSLEEQRQRFLSRLDDPDKNWKFSGGDLVERSHWPRYMAAYEEALRETSRPWAPWYAIPADDKPSMRAAVAEIVCATLEGLDLRYPELGKKEQSQLQNYRAQLESER